MGERGEEGRGLRGGSVVLEHLPGPVYPPNVTEKVEERAGNGLSYYEFTLILSKTTWEDANRLNLAVLLT